MSAEIITWNGITRLDLPAERVIAEALGASLDEVVIIGFDQDGEFYFASNKADAGTVLYHLEMAKMKLMRICEEGIPD